MYRTIKGIFVLMLLFFSVAFSQCPNDVPNSYIRSKDVYDRNIDKYMGIKYLFYNILVYDNESYIPPYPYYGGRVRNGKFKASQTAMDNYLQNLSNYSGKVFTPVGLANEEDDMPGIIMACENGDTLLFNANIVDGQFINEEYLKEEQKDIGLKVYYLNPKSNRRLIENEINSQNAQTARDIYDYFYGFKNIITSSSEFYLPYLSQWTVTNIVYDTTFIGKKKIKNNPINATKFNRIKFTIENPNYGKYDLFVYNINDLNVAAVRNDSIIFTGCKLTYDIKVSNCKKQYPDSFSALAICGSDKDDHNYYANILKNCPVNYVASEIQPEWTYVYWRNLDPARSYLDPKFNRVEYELQYPEEDYKRIKEWASKGFIEAVYAKAVAIDKEKCNQYGCSPQIIDCAKKGYLAAIQSVSHWYTSEFVDGDTKVDMIKQAWKKYGPQQKIDRMLDYIVVNNNISYNLIELYQYAGKNGYENVEQAIKEIKQAEQHSKEEKEIENVEKQITAENLKKQGIEKLFAKVHVLKKNYYTNSSDYYRRKKIKRMYEDLLEMQEKNILQKYGDKLSSRSLIRRWIDNGICNDNFSQGYKQHIEEIQSYKQYIEEILSLYKLAKKYDYPGIENNIEHTEKIEQKLTACKKLEIENTQK